MGKGVSPERGRQRGLVGVPPLKRCYLAAIGSYSVTTAADTCCIS